MVVPGREFPPVELVRGRLIAVGVSNDAAGIAKLLGGDVALVVQAGNVGLEIIVVVVDALAGVKINMDIGELRVE